MQITCFKRVGHQNEEKRQEQQVKLSRTNSRSEVLMRKEQGADVDF
jgi:hypothetical protein